MMLEVRELKTRRNERFEAVKSRINDFEDDAKFYKNTTSKKIVDKVCKTFKEHSKREHTCIGDLPYTNYLDIKQSSRDSFIENIVEQLREASYNWIEKELSNVEKDLTTRFISDNINKVSESSRKSYLLAVKKLVCLDKISRIDDMEKKLFELQKDLISCINYNDKIEKAKGLNG